MSTDSQATTTPTKTLDVRHHFRGFWATGGVCRVRVFESPGAPLVIIITELPENENTSVTNLIEHLAPEIIRDYLPGILESETRPIILEHDAAGAHRKVRKPDVDRVTFASWRPRVVNLNGAPRLAFEGPEWAPVAADELARLIGEGVSLDE